VANPGLTVFCYVVSEAAPQLPAAGQAPAEGHAAAGAEASEEVLAELFPA